MELRIIETQGVRHDQVIREDELMYSPDDEPDEPDEPDYPGEYNVWICYGANPCNICLANMAAGPVAAGEAFPSGDTAPPAHDHCQCDLEAADEGDWPIPIVPKQRDTYKSHGTRQGRAPGDEYDDQGTKEGQ